jgi:hypothetical protein
MSKRHVLVLAALQFVMATIAAVPSVAFAHRDWCHGLHACPSDQGSYICGDQGRCDLCPDNEYCKGRVSRQGAESLAVPVLRQEISRKLGERGGGKSGSASGGGGTGTGSNSAKQRKPCPRGTQRAGASATAIANEPCSKPKPTKSAREVTPRHSEAGSVPPADPGNDGSK